MTPIIINKLFYFLRFLKVFAGCKENHNNTPKQETITDFAVAQPATIHNNTQKQENTTDFEVTQPATIHNNTPKQENTTDFEVTQHATIHNNTQKQENTTDFEVTQPAIIHNNTPKQENTTDFAITQPATINNDTPKQENTTDFAVTQPATIHNNTQKQENTTDNTKANKTEWAKKMREAKLQKKKQRDKEKQEFAEGIEKIGGRVIWKNNNYFDFDIFLSEQIGVEKLFKYLFKDNMSICYNCYITDRNNNKIAEYKYDNNHTAYMYFYDKPKRLGLFESRTHGKEHLLCYLKNREIKRFEEYIPSVLSDGINQINSLQIIDAPLESQIRSALEDSNYSIDFHKNIDCILESEMLIVDYDLPDKSIIPEEKEYKFIVSQEEIRIKKNTEAYMIKCYDKLLYSITLRSIYEIFYIDRYSKINEVTFNGYVTSINTATGNSVRRCVLSIQADRKKYSQINLLQVDPKACFKALKGVSATNLINISPVIPILTFDKNDKRFIEGKTTDVSQGTNLASMHWEEFEHLVRELFEMEFKKNGGDVRVTQASRDGGVDAIIFDPDPLRGGKIVVQAKRYTNTVGVSAVRDLYGTVINEGANSGILITTSDYGHDSYEFAKDKPLKLLNGGHLLGLLHRNGKEAHINIEEAKKILENEKNA